MSGSECVCFMLQPAIQQQAALMAAAAQGSYLNPMAALAAAHVQQANPIIAAPNGLSSAALTPTTTGKNHRISDNYHSQSCYML